MSPRSSISGALAVLALLVAACAKPPPPPPPPEPPPAPPPPKCESLAEKCDSKADTKAKITSSTLVFTPTTGWIFAMQSSATVAQSSETGPAIAFMGIDLDTKDIKKEVAEKDAAIIELCKQLGLAPLKRKVAWKKPDKKENAGSLKLDLWQLDESGVRGAKKGPLLVIATTVSEGHGVVGMGFVPDDDKTGADDAIMKSILSLGTSQ